MPDLIKRLEEAREPTRQADIAERYRRHGTEEWQRRGSAFEHHRYSEPVPSKSRRRCSCCKRRATHMGRANGVTLITGCEMRVARWVRNPAPTPRPEAGEGVE